MAVPAYSCFDSWKTKIGNEEVHSWVGTIEQIFEHLPLISKVVSASEHEQAMRYHFGDDRRRFLACHGMLRLLISRYLSVAPEDIIFFRNHWGKPFIRSHGLPPLMFSMSHSHHAVLYGFSLGRRIGVDIEFMKPMPDVEDIAAHFFSRYEYTELKALPENLRKEAFYHCWTQKEAFVKALGEGLSRSLDQFDVSVAPGSPAALRETRWDEKEVGRWSLASAQLLSGYQAAVAIEGAGLTIRCGHLTEEIFQQQLPKHAKDV